MSAFWESYITCQHDRTELRRRTLASGNLQLRRQCMDCGRGIGSAHSQKNLSRPLDAYPLWDDAIEGALIEADAVARKIKRETWWEDYNTYLASPKWARKREKVMRRAGGTCEACGDRPAQEVHHLTYENVGAEPLWDLRAVCRPCHEYIHGKDGSEIEGREA